MNPMRWCLPLLLLSSGVFAQDCAWLPTAIVDEAVPDHAPWRAFGGEQGRCDFASDATDAPTFITVERSYHATPAEAESAASSMREALAGLFTALPEPSLGSEAFTGVAAIHGGELLSVVGHRERLYVEVKLGFASGIREPHRPAGLALARYALGTAAQLAETEGLKHCPQLDVASLGPNFSDARVSLPKEGTCVIRAGTHSLTLEIEHQSQADDLIQYLIKEDCTTEPVPALGESARLVWGCGKKTRLLHGEGKTLVSYDYASSRPSHPEDRSWLAEVAARRARSGAK